MKYNGVKNYYLYSLRAYFKCRLSRPPVLPPLFSLVLRVSSDNYICEEMIVIVM